MEKFKHFFLIPDFMLKMDGDCMKIMMVLMNEFSLLDKFNSKKIINNNGIKYIQMPFEKIIEKTNLTKNKIIGAVKGLIQAEYIYVENKGKKNELFTINFELIHLIDSNEIDAPECNKIARNKSAKNEVVISAKESAEEEEKQDITKILNESYMLNKIHSARSKNELNIIKSDIDSYINSINDIDEKKAQYNLLFNQLNYQYKFV